MKYKENIKNLLGKQVIFKLTEDKYDEGLIGILKEYKDNLIIERDGVKLVFEIDELYKIEEYNSNN